MYHPRCDAWLLGLSVALLGALLCLPPSRWFAPPTVPFVLLLSAAWVLWRLVALERTLATYRAWTRNATWTLTVESLAHEEG